MNINNKYICSYQIIIIIKNNFLILLCYKQMYLFITTMIKIMISLVTNIINYYYYN